MRDQNAFLGARLPRVAQTARASGSGWGVSCVLGGLAILVTLAARNDGPFPGEADITSWIHRNTPAPIDLVGDVLDPLVTDLSAPLLFAAIGLLVWWRWGRHATIVLGLAGGFTALTRIGDLVERPRPTSSGTWTTYTYGNGGYPSGHVVFTVLVLGTVAILARRHSTPAVGRRLRWLAVVLIALTCWTRISHLEHWPLDVVGGLLLALLMLYVVVGIERTIDPRTVGHPRLRRLLGLPAT